MWLLLSLYRMIIKIWFKSIEIAINPQIHTICWVSWCLPLSLPTLSRSFPFYAWDQWYLPVLYVLFFGTPCLSRPISFWDPAWFLSPLPRWDIVWIILMKLLVWVLLVQSLDHFVLLLDVLFDFSKIVRHLSVVLLEEIVDWILVLFCHRQNVLNCICNNEVFVWFQAMHRILIGARYTLLFMLAIVWKIVH